MVIGWDIGGVNTKVASAVAGRVLAVREEPFELQRDPQALVPLLRRLADSVGSDPQATHAVTMTAELSQMFRTKREGVAFVLDAVENAFPRGTVRVFSVHGDFITPAEARMEPLAVAASNWMATGMMVASRHPDALLIDVGTTTTDIIPLVAGRVTAAGTTDLARLASSELVYSGLVRTPAEAVTHHVTVGGRRVGVTAEGFALIGDAHVWRGHLSESDYTVPTPDGRPATREYAAERLCRFVCADREMLNDEDVSVIADAIALAQQAQLAEALRTVNARHPSLRRAVVTGRGAFVGAAAAGEAGLEVAWLAEELGMEAARSAPAVAVALLCQRENPTAAQGTWQTQNAAGVAKPALDIVIKVGGGSLRTPDSLASVLEALNAARGCRMLIVPGGGLFADAVRDVDRRMVLRDGTAHWMAIRAMDQFAELLASRLERGLLVQTPVEIRRALDAGALPVLAPLHWLRAADPLPHSWDVTSDSIAAWVAGVMGARQLVLVKPHESQTGVDRHFDSALPDGVRLVILGVEQSGLLASVLDEACVAAGQGAGAVDREFSILRTGQAG